MEKADWKKICELLPMLRVRYLAGQNARLARLLAEPGKTETDRFWDTFEEMKNQSGILRDCLAGYSRSSMWLNMKTMLSIGRLKPEDLADFREDLRAGLTADVSQ